MGSLVETTSNHKRTVSPVGRLNRHQSQSHRSVHDGQGGMYRDIERGTVCRRRCLCLGCCRCLSRRDRKCRRCRRGRRRIDV